MSSKSLYKINGDLLRLTDEIEQAEGVLTPEMEAALEISSGELMTKAVDYGYAILKLKARQKEVKAELDRIAAIKKSVDNTLKRLEGAVQGAMEMHEIEKIEGETLNLSFRKSKRMIQDALVTDAIDNLPASMKTTTTTTKPDNAAIKKALEEGEEFEGFEIRVFNNLQIK